MKPLLEIHSVPISIEYKTSSARIEKVDSKAYIEVSRNRSKYQMRSLPIKFDVDTIERNRSPMPHVSKQSAGPADVSSADGARNGASYQASVQFGDDGEIFVGMELNQEAVDQIRSAKVRAAGTEFLPIKQAKGKVIPESVSMTIRYEMEKLSHEMKAKNKEIEFIPADLEFSVKEHPDVVIKYIGGPIYVPPSADPEYVPVDAKV